MYVPDGQLFSIASERPLDSFPNSHNTYLLQYTNSFPPRLKGKEYVRLLQDVDTTTDLR